MKGLLILPKKKMYSEDEEEGMEGEDGSMEDEGEDNVDEDFSEIFSSFVSALGVEPKNIGKAEKRFKALLGMVCDKYMK